MRNNTRRALRATATVAGVAALAGTFAGTAFADSGLGGLGGDNSFGGSDSHGLSGLGDSDGGSVFDEPGLGNFEMPGMGMGSKGFRTDNTFDTPFGSNSDDDWDGGGRHGRNDDCGDSGDGYHSGSYGVFQNPLQCKDNNILKNINFDGHDVGRHGRNDWNSSYKSIGSRDFRTSGGLFGGDDSDWGDDGGSSGIHGDSIFSHSDRGTSSDNWGDDDNYGSNWDSGDSDGLSGHHIKLPIGN